MEELIRQLESLTVSLPTCEEIYTYPKVTDPSPKIAFYIMGPAGAGKTTTYKTFFKNPNNHLYYNFDNYYEALLKLNASYLNTLEKAKANSLHAKLMNHAKKCIQADLSKLTTSGNMLVIDTPGANLPTIRQMHKALAAAGYTQYGIFVSAPLETLLEHNKQRSRQLPEKAIRELYSKTQKNKSTLKKLFTFIEPEKIPDIINGGLAAQTKS